MLHAKPPVDLFSRAVSRRRILQSGLAWAAASAWDRPWTAFARAAESAVPTADQLIVGKDRRLLVHNPAQTGFEIETPLELLREDKITPPEKLFVRNNQQPDWSATLEPALRAILPPAPGRNSTLCTTVPTGMKRNGRALPERISAP